MDANALEIREVEMDSGEGTLVPTQEDRTGSQMELEKKIDHLLCRVKELERRIPIMGERESLSKECERETSWTKVLDRRKRQERKGGPEQEPQVQERRREEGSRQRSKSRSRNRPLKALERRLPKGAGVMIEIQGGGNREYEELVKECERAIPLKEVGIPPHRHKKNKRWGDPNGNQGRKAGGKGRITDRKD